MGAKEKLQKSKNGLDKTIEVLIKQFDGLHDDNPLLYEKFELLINLIIETLDNSLTELTKNVCDSLEGLSKLLEDFLARGGKS